MPTLGVYSINGMGRREILIPGRSAMRPFGAIQIVNNVGQRQESDWAAIKAALAAGDVCICLSKYETDVLPEHLEGMFPYGGNVRFETKRNPQWHLVTDGPYAHFEDIPWQCVHCGDTFATQFHLAGHAQRVHRGIAERAAAEVAAE